MGNFLALFSSDFDNRLVKGALPEPSRFEDANDATPLSRAEQDAWFLSGKFWEPEPLETGRDGPGAQSERP